MILNYYQMQSRGSSGGEPDAVRFYDLDGSILYQYSPTEFAALTEMPANPTHTGLVSQGWNWTLADAQEYVAETGYIDIGQNYNTSDGNCHFHVIVYESNKNARYIASKLNASDSTVTLTIDWGDGSTPTTFNLTGTEPRSTPHTYTSGGEYDIVVSSTGDYAIGSTNADEDNLIFNGFQGGESDAGDIIWAHLSTSIKRMDGYCFRASHLREVSLPNTITSMYCEFNGADMVAQITVPSSCTEILNYNSFYQTISATSISLPKSLTRLCGYQAFGYSGIKSVNLTDSIVDTSSLSSVSIYGQRYMFDTARNLKYLYLPTVFNGNFYSTFRACTSLEKLEILGSVTECNYMADNCSALREVSMTNSGLTNIGTNAFSNCTALTNVNFPSSVTSIGANAFKGDKSLVKVGNLSNVKSIDTNAFYMCNSLRIDTSKITSFNSLSFYGCKSLYPVFNTNEPVTITGEQSLAVSRCTNIVFPATVETATGFAYTYTLYSADIYSNNIGSRAFHSCTRLHQCNLYNTQNIGDNVFFNCRIRQISIPQTILNIGDNAFRNCAQLHDIYIGASTPPTLGGTNAFYGLKSGWVLHVPSGSLSDYQTASNWSYWSSHYTED